MHGLHAVAAIFQQQRPVAGVNGCGSSLRLDRVVGRGFLLGSTRCPRCSLVRHAAGREVGRFKRRGIVIDVQGFRVDLGQPIEVVVVLHEVVQGGGQGGSRGQNQAFLDFTRPVKLAKLSLDFCRGLGATPLMH